MEGLRGRKHNSCHTKHLNQSNPDTDVFPTIVGNLRTRPWMAVIHVGEVLWGYYVVDLDTLPGNRFESVNTWSMKFDLHQCSYALFWQFGNAWVFGLLSYHSHHVQVLQATILVFLEGDALCEGNGNGWESLTGTCSIRFPCRVCAIMTSCMLDFGVESHIFGIAGLFYAGLMMVRRTKKIDISYWCCNQFYVFEISVKAHVLPYACMWQMRMQSSATHCFFD